MDLVNDEGILGKKIETPSLQCSIEDIYTLGLKHAHLKRIIKYRNPSSQKARIDFYSTDHIFSHNCSNFECTVNGTQVKIQPPNNRDYSKVIIINKPSSSLATGEELEIIINCVWKNFVNFLDDCYLAFSYKQRATYKLTIIGWNIVDRKFKILVNGKNSEDEDIRFDNTGILFFDYDPKIIIPKDSINIKLLVANTPKQLTVFDPLFKSGDNIFNDYVVILIQHLLSDFIHLVEKIELYGGKKENTFICGIPYSTKETTVEYLELSGYPQIYTPEEYPFDNNIKNLLRNAINCAKLKGNKILVIEDGGYIFPILHTDKEFQPDKQLFEFIVEQTTNGINRDIDVINENGLKSYSPIVNVAKSHLKSRIESMLIGKTVVNNIELLLSKNFIGIEGKVFGMVGYGDTGKTIAKKLIDRGASGKIFDKSTLGHIEASFGDGLTVVDSPMEAIEKSDIVIESSGSNSAWAGIGEFSKFKNGSYFLSSSSKQLGLNYEELEKITLSTINLPGIGKRYLLTNKNHINLLADGYPINFFMGESVPDNQIQFIIALLFGAAYYGIKNKEQLKPEIIDMDDPSDPYGYLKLQSDIEKVYRFSN